MSPPSFIANCMCVFGGRESAAAPLACSELFALLANDCGGEDYARRVRDDEDARAAAEAPADGVGQLFSAGGAVPGLVHGTTAS